MRAKRAEARKTRSSDSGRGSGDPEGPTLSGGQSGP